MKIAHVIPYMHPAAGGPPVVVDRLATELTKLGHDVRVLTTNQFAEGDRDWERVGSRAYSMSVFPTSRTFRYAYCPQLTAATRQAAMDCDVVHIHTLWTNASRAAMSVCCQRRTPYLVMPHGMLDPHSLRRGWLKKQIYGRTIEWPLLRRAAGMCYTHTEERRLATQSCAALPTGHIVELGAELAPEVSSDELKKGFLEQHPHLRNKTVVLFLGRLHEKKGLALLIPAFEEVARRINDAHLLLVGPGETDYVDSIRRDVSQRGLDSRVTFTGSLYGCDKWGAMAASNLFVLPSFQENFALAAVDAIRSGLPVLLSPRVNLCDDIVAAGAGRRCDLTTDSVAQQIISCLRDTEWREQAVVAGKSLLQSRFQWEASAVQLESIYSDIVLAKCHPAMT